MPLPQFIARPGQPFLFCSSSVQDAEPVRTGPATQCHGGGLWPQVMWLRQAAMLVLWTEGRREREVKCKAVQPGRHLEQSC